MLTSLVDGDGGHDGGAAVAEGCLLNMPRKIGFEILIFPRRVSTVPTPLSLYLLTPSRSFFYPRFFSLNGCATIVSRMIPLATEKYTFYPEAKYRCRYC